jgi:hypothetical protein
VGAGSTYKLGSVTNAALGGWRGSFLSSSSGLKSSRLKKPGVGYRCRARARCRVNQAFPLNQAFPVNQTMSV